MKKFNVLHLILFTGFYGIFSIIMGAFFTNEMLSVWMGINVGFAMIPLIVIVYLYNRFIDDNKIDLFLVIGLLVFLFFYPNSFYILTDFIHVDFHDFYHLEPVYGFFSNFETVYRLTIEPYIMLFHIIVSAIIGAVAGIQSLLYLERMVELKFQKKWITELVVIVMLGLSSVGIYLGRFLRFFSFDILRPIHLLTTFFESIDLFTFSFVFFFTILEMIIYYGYRYIMKTPNVV